MPWVHMEPIPGHPIQADIDVTTLPNPVRFGAAGDFDGDGLAELVLAPDKGAGGANDLWVMKYNTGTGRWDHLSPIPGHSLMADIDISSTPVPILTALAGNFDGRGSAELAVVPKGQHGLWVMRYDRQRLAWDHLSPVSSHPIRADIPLPWPVKFAVAGDFDGDGRSEIAVVPQDDGLIWIMKFKGGGAWFRQDEITLERLGGKTKFLTAGRFDGGPHWLALAPELPAPAGSTLLALRRKADGWLQVPLALGGNPVAVPRFAAVGSFEGGPREQIALGIAPGPGRGNEFWVLTCTVEQPGDFFYWRPLNEIPGHPLHASILCCQARCSARFAVAGDFDGDGKAELAVAPEAGGSAGNDFWVMKYDGTAWAHMGPLPASSLQADLDASPLKHRARFAVAANFGSMPDSPRASIAVAIAENDSRGNDLWVMHYVDEPGPKVTLTGTLSLTALDPLTGPRQPVQKPVQLKLEFNPFRHRFAAEPFAPVHVRALETLGGRWEATVTMPEQAEGSANTSTGAMTLDLPLRVEMAQPGSPAEVATTRCTLTTGLIRGRHPVEGGAVDPQTGVVTLVGLGQFQGGPLDGTEYILGLVGVLAPNPLP